MLLNIFLFVDFQEIVIILVAVVILFGPNSLPEIARGLGTALRKFKSASDEIKSEILNPRDINSSLDASKKKIDKNISSFGKDITNEIDELKQSLDPFDRRIKRDDF